MPSQVKETAHNRGLGSAGLRRLSRRGSWVQIPPPAPFDNAMRLLPHFAMAEGKTQKDSVWPSKNEWLVFLASPPERFYELFS